MPKFQGSDNCRKSVFVGRARKSHGIENFFEEHTFDALEEMLFRAATPMKDNSRVSVGQLLDPTITLSSARPESGVPNITINHTRSWEHATTARTPPEVDVTHHCPVKKEEECATQEDERGLILMAGHTFDNLKRGIPITQQNMVLGNLWGRGHVSNVSGDHKAAVPAYKLKQPNRLSPSSKSPGLIRKKDNILKPKSPNVRSPKILVKKTAQNSEMNDIGPSDSSSSCPGTTVQPSSTYNAGSAASALRSRLAAGARGTAACPQSRASGASAAQPSFLLPVRGSSCAASTSSTATAATATCSSATSSASSASSAPACASSNAEATLAHRPSSTTCAAGMRSSSSPLSTASKSKSKGRRWMMWAPFRTRILGGGNTKKTESGIFPLRTKMDTSSPREGDKKNQKGDGVSKRGGDGSKKEGKKNRERTPSLSSTSSAASASGSSTSWSIASWSSKANKTGPPQHDEMCYFQRELRAYQFETDQVGSMPLLTRLRQDGREDLIAFIERYGHKALADRLGLRVRMDAVGPFL